MREMKNSGIDWIGEIPIDWDILPAKRFFRNVKRVAGKDADNFERLALTLNGVIKRSKTDNEGLQPEQFESYQILKENEMVFKLIDLENVKTSRVGLSSYTGLVSPAYIVLTNENKDNRFYYYWFISMYYNEVFNHLGGSGVRSALNAKDLLNIPIPNINGAERKKISDFLDEKCAKIDAVIEKQKQVIEKLKEYKLSVITEAVTKGLDPTVPMKDSGVEWIGEMPSRWCLVPFKYVLNERNEKNIPIKTDERLSLSIDKGITLYAEKTTNLDRFKDDVSLYKLAHKGDFVLNSMNMIVGAVGISNYFGCVSPAYYVYYDCEDDHITAKFCDYLFKSKSMRKVLYSLGKGIMAIDRGDGRVNTCRLKVSRDDLRSLKIPVPPIIEQRKIVEKLRKIEIKIDSAIKIRENTIEKLTEYKKSLIYEVVTGKREV